MGAPKFHISKAKLQHLYLQESLSAAEIGRRLGCSYSTVINRLLEHGIPLKSVAKARMRYAKHDFDGDSNAKAYMMGFRVGDLNVYREYRASETITVRCHTTHQAQIKVMRSIFESFGHIGIRRRDKNLHATAYLNNSFAFLIPKDFTSWQWVRRSTELVAWAFIAGYTDAEGSFGIYQGKARFKVDSYDGRLLQWYDRWLRNLGISSILNRISRKGTTSHQGYVWKSDLWRLTINSAGSVEGFVDGVLPFLIHEKRKRDAMACLENILERRLHGTIS